MFIGMLEGIGSMDGAGGNALGMHLYLCITDTLGITPEGTSNSTMIITW